MNGSPERGGIDARFGPGLFVVWSPRHRGTRSAWLAAELGIQDLRYFAPTRRRGLLAAPLKYPRQIVATLTTLARRRPSVVFVQSPPSIAGWCVLIYARITRAAFVIDAHSDAFERQIWTRPFWLNRLVARGAVLTIVTTEYWAERIRAGGGEAMIVPAVPTALAVGEPPPLADGFNVAVVNTWAPDEPLMAVLDAAVEVPDATFHITGDDGRVAKLDRPIPGNVRFTGFLAESTYHGLLAHADVVMCLTTRDHTMQNGAAEALYLGTPIITSDWRVLRDYFSSGTVHVDNSARSIARAVDEVRASPAEYRAAIRVLRDTRLEQWERDRAAIMARIAGQLRRLRGAARGGAPAGGSA